MYHVYFSSKVMSALLGSSRYYLSIYLFYSTALALTLYPFQMDSIPKDNGIG